MLTACIVPVWRIVSIVWFGVVSATPTVAAAGVEPDSAGPQGVELAAGFVHAWAGTESTRVECVYFLRNRGGATRIEVPFPATRDGLPGTAFRHVESFVDGTPVGTLARPVQDEDRPGGVLWYVAPVDFDARQSRIVRDVYEGVRLEEITFGQETEHGFSVFTGRRWSGDVGAFDVVLTLDALGSSDEVVRTLPEATSHAGNEFRWHFDGFVPGAGFGSAPTIAVRWRSRRSHPQH